MMDYLTRTFLKRDNLVLVSYRCETNYGTY